MKPVATRWLFDPSGHPAYYSNDDGTHLYSAASYHCMYHITEDGFIVRMPPAVPVPRFYIQDGWVYDMTGKPAYYFGEST